MKLTILGSGGCMIIPKPLCNCRVCREAREKGIPYARSGPAALLHDASLLIDAPAEIAAQLNRERIQRLDYLMLTHLDPDHVEGLRVVEQIALDFRSWQAYPEKQTTILLPEALQGPLRTVATQYGPVIDHYLKSGFLRLEIFRDKVNIRNISITALPVDRGRWTAFIYVFENDGKRIVYAACDIKPFPVDRPEVQNPDLLVIQPGIFESGLKHNFVYPPDHVSRTTLYTFEETLALAREIGSRQTVFVHLEEYWNRGYDDYLMIEKRYPNIRFAHDGLCLEV